MYLQDNDKDGDGFSIVRYVAILPAVLFACGFTICCCLNARQRKRKMEEHVRYQVSIAPVGAFYPTTTKHQGKHIVVLGYLRTPTGVEYATADRARRVAEEELSRVQATKSQTAAPHGENQFINSINIDNID